MNFGNAPLPPAVNFGTSPTPPAVSQTRVPAASVNLAQRPPAGKTPRPSYGGKTPRTGYGGKAMKGLHTSPTSPLKTVSAPVPTNPPAQTEEARRKAALLARASKISAAAPAATTPTSPLITQWIAELRDRRFETRVDSAAKIDADLRTLQSEAQTFLDGRMALVSAAVVGEAREKMAAQYLDIFKSRREENDALASATDLLAENKRAKDVKQKTTTTNAAGEQVEVDSDYESDGGFVAMDSEELASGDDRSDDDDDERAKREAAAFALDDVASTMADLQRPRIPRRSAGLAQAVLKTLSVSGSSEDESASDYDAAGESDDDVEMSEGKRSSEADSSVHEDASASEDKDAGVEAHLGDSDNSQEEEGEAREDSVNSQEEREEREDIALELAIRENLRDKGGKGHADQAMEVEPGHEEDPDDDEESTVDVDAPALGERGALDAATILQTLQRTRYAEVAINHMNAGDRANIVTYFRSTLSLLIYYMLGLAGGYDSLLADLHIGELLARRGATIEGTRGPSPQINAFTALFESLDRTTEDLMPGFAEMRQNPAGAPDLPQNMDFYCRVLSGDPITYVRRIDEHTPSAIVPPTSLVVKDALSQGTIATDHLPQMYMAVRAMYSANGTPIAWNAARSKQGSRTIKTVKPKPQDLRVFLCTLEPPETPRRKRARAASESSANPSPSKKSKKAAAQKKKEEKAKEEEKKKKKEEEEEEKKKKKQAEEMKKKKKQAEEEKKKKRAEEMKKKKQAEEMKKKKKQAEEEKKKKRAEEMKKKKKEKTTKASKKRERPDASEETSGNVRPHKAAHANTPEGIPQIGSEERYVPLRVHEELSKDVFLAVPELSVYLTGNYDLARFPILRDRIKQKYPELHAAAQSFSGAVGAACATPDLKARLKALVVWYRGLETKRRYYVNEMAATLTRILQEPKTSTKLANAVALHETAMRQADASDAASSASGDLSLSDMSIDLSEEAEKKPEKKHSRASFSSPIQDSLFGDTNSLAVARPVPSDLAQALPALLKVLLKAAEKLGDDLRIVISPAASALLLEPILGKLLVNYGVAPDPQLQRALNAL